MRGHQILDRREKQQLTTPTARALTKRICARRDALESAFGPSDSALLSRLGAFRPLGPCQLLSALAVRGESHGLEQGDSPLAEGRKGCFCLSQQRVKPFPGAPQARATRRGWPCRAPRPWPPPCRGLPRRLAHRADRRRAGRPGRTMRIANSAARSDGCARPSTAPASQAKRNRAPVLSACIAAISIGAEALPRGAEIERLAERHAPPAAGLGEQQDKLGADGGISMRLRSLRISKASVSSASPARMAVASSKAICSVGRPRRTASSSMEGKSSCTRE